MFSEQAYLFAYPDVAAAVNAGSISSGLQHYTQYGQFEQNRVGFFFGSSENDTITGFGNGSKIITGVSYDTLLDSSPVAGVGEVDILIGTEGTDIFVLGHPTILPLTPAPQQFYVGGGNTDYAIIKNFNLDDNDSIVLEGPSQNYNIEVVNGSTNISTASGDLVAIVEEVTDLFPLDIEVANGSASITASGFLFDTVELVDIVNLDVPLDVTGSFSVFL